MKHTIELTADQEYAFREFGAKHHIDDLGTIITRLAVGLLNGTYKWEGRQMTRVKPKRKWNASVGLPAKCFEPGVLPDRGYWSKPLPRSQHLACLESHFPGAIVRPLVAKSGEPLKWGWKIKTELNWTVKKLASAEQKARIERGLNGKNATVGDLITTLELLYRASDLPIPTETA